MFFFNTKYTTKKYADGGSVSQDFLHLVKLTYPDGDYRVESYEGKFMHPKDAMEKMQINLRSYKAYKYKGLSSDTPAYKKWFQLKAKGKTNEQAWQDVVEKQYADGGYVAVGEKDGYWTVISKPSSKEKAQQVIDMGSLPHGEVGKVVTVSEAKAHNKLVGAEYLADGGKVLSNHEVIQNLEFEDNTDMKDGYYTFTFDTVDAEGAPMHDYSGSITLAPTNSRRDDEVEFDGDMPEDWEAAEAYIIDKFYEWKNN